MHGLSAVALGKVRTVQPNTSDDVHAWTTFVLGFVLALFGLPAGEEASHLPYLNRTEAFRAVIDNSTDPRLPRFPTLRHEKKRPKGAEPLRTFRCEKQKESDSAYFAPFFILKLNWWHCSQ